MDADKNGDRQVNLDLLEASATVVKGMTAPAIPNAKSVHYDAWPKSLKALAAEMAQQAISRQRMKTTNPRWLSLLIVIVLRSVIEQTNILDH